MTFNARYVFAISLVAALGGLLFGYDWVVIGGAKPFYETYFDLNTGQQVGWANSCALVGCLLGSMAAGRASDRFGRKRLLIAAAALFAVSSVLTGWAHTFLEFVGWRIAGGVAIGIASNVSPVYIAEVSPAAWRGRLVALNQLTIVAGILAAQLVNWWIARPVPADATAEMIRLSWNGQFGWRWMFTAVAVPSMVFLAGAFAVPESPRWLLAHGSLERARRTLARIGGESYADREFQEIQQTVGELPAAGWGELLNARLRRLLGVGILLAVLQQWSGINVIFNYAEEIYRAAGYGVSEILFNIVITGAINLVFTLVALGLVDRLGRRALMLAGCAGIAISHFLIGAAYASGVKGLPVLILTLATIACYAMSLAPVTWVLISEIFPNRIRGAAVSVAVSALWVACFVLTFTFPELNAALGPQGTFWLYSGICAAGLVFVWRRVPETKGKTLEQIEREYAGREPVRAL
ncbi:MAG TPA: sugar porter family MFS transporter [Verrucomicrobiae bacterium]|nr:sugar porter family MFS transporter [Verrucomicrobiae bacterium]